MNGKQLECGADRVCNLGVLPTGTGGVHQESLPSHIIHFAGLRGLDFVRITPINEVCTQCILRDIQC